MRDTASDPPVDADALSTTIRCPAIEHPDLPLVDPAVFAPLLARLADPAPLDAEHRYTHGTLQPDGRVDLCKQGLGPVGVRTVLDATIGSPHARHLLLGTNSLGNEGAAAVAAALGGGHRIETVYLGCNRISADGVAPIAQRLAGDTTVRSLWLKRNPVGDRGVTMLAEALRTNATIRTLDLVNTGVSIAGLRRVAEVLADRQARVERLFVGGNGLGPDAAEVLADLLRAGVTELYAAANHLGDRGARVLAETAGDLVTGAASRPDAGAPAVGGSLVGLGRGGSLISLGLGGNGVTPAGVAALAERLDAFAALDLARPPSQRALGAPDNHVGDEGAALLAARLPASALRRLDLRHTGVTGHGAKLLVAAAAQAPALAYLGLGFGVPRRLRRAAATLTGPGAQPHGDIRAVASVYR